MFYEYTGKGIGGRDMPGVPPGMVGKASDSGDELARSLARFDPGSGVILVPWVDLRSAPLRVERITTASERYDGFGTRTIELLPFVDHSGQRYRKVQVEAEHYLWQYQRYWSGLYPLWTPEQFEELAASDSRQVRRLA